MQTGRRTAGATAHLPLPSNCSFIPLKHSAHSKIHKNIRRWLQVANQAVDVSNMYARTYRRLNEMKRCCFSRGFFWECVSRSGLGCHDSRSCKRSNCARVCARRELMCRDQYRQKLLRPAVCCCSPQTCLTKSGGRGSRQPGCYGIPKSIETHFVKIDRCAERQSLGWTNIYFQCGFFCFFYMISWARLQSEKVQKLWMLTAVWSCDHTTPSLHENTNQLHKGVSVTKPHGDGCYLKP